MSEAALAADYSALIFAAYASTAAILVALGAWIARRNARIRAELRALEQTGPRRKGGGETA